MVAAWLTKSDSNEIILKHPSDGSGERTYDLINDPLLQDPANDKTKIAAVIKELMQADLEVRVRVRDLVDEDPDKASDPGRGDLFWEGQGVNRELVSRTAIVDRVIWDETEQLYVIRLRRAR